MDTAAFWKRFIRACCLLWLGVILSQTAPCGFGRAKQQPLSELRERTGLSIRVSASGTDGAVLSKEEAIILKQISIASEKRDWHAASSSFATYGGSATQIYAAAMHAALRCRKYKEGANIYKQCKTNCPFIGLPAFTVALRIFAKLGETTSVQNIWDDALNTHELNAILGSARIVAAAEFGNVTMAADTLDILNNSALVNVYHINSAMRACWGWGNNQHKAAKYFFDLLHNFTLSPTIVSFTSLIGAYKTASLQDILSAYDDMKSLQIEPDTVFAETYIFSLLQADGKMRVQNHLHQISVGRLQAARDALADFKDSGLHLSRACEDVYKRLKCMGF